MEEVKEWLTDRKDGFYALFRIVVGLLFAQNGAQKLFGVLGGTAMAFPDFMFWIGAIEFFGGLLVAVGLFTRISAFLTFAVMVGAQIKVHIPQRLLPTPGKGERSMLYLIAFLLILVHGPGKYSLANYLWRKS